VPFVPKDSRLCQLYAAAEADVHGFHPMRGYQLLYCGEVDVNECPAVQVTLSTQHQTELR